jgi:hypothetical protein
MSQRNHDLLKFYAACRVDDQVDFYERRSALFDRATSQGLAVSAVLLGFSTAAAALAGTAVAWATGWSAIATILPAVSTALAGYVALYAFDQQSKIYGDALKALRMISRAIPDPDSAPEGQTPERNIAGYVERVESIFSQEQGQWGQLTSQIQATDQAKGG